MALKVELKPNERILIGESVITNCDQRSWLVIEGASPILREKDILTPSRADTPAKRIYLAVQLMYTSRDPRAHHEVYFALVRQIVQAAPSTWSYIENINNQILTGNLYKALKEAKKLIVYEEGLLRECEVRPKPTKTWQGKPQVRVSSRRRFCCKPQPVCNRCTTPGTEQAPARRSPAVQPQALVGVPDRGDRRQQSDAAGRSSERRQHRPVRDEPHRHGDEGSATPSISAR